MTHLAGTSRPTRGSAVPRSRAGFTLIEASLVTVIVGVGVLAIVSAQQAYHQHNAYSQRIGTALLLANEIRELTLMLPRHDPIDGPATWGPEPGELGVAQYDDLDDFAGPDGLGTTFNPPIDAMRRTIPDMERWTQIVTVESVLPNFVSGSATPNNATAVMRLTCRVLFHSPGETEPREITRLSWLRAGGR